jgi:hypothetical protein
MTTPKRDTTQAIEERGPVKARYARLFGPILRGMLLVVGLCAFVPCVAGFLHPEEQGSGLALAFFVLASLALMVITPKPDTAPLTARQFGFAGWSLVSYGVIIGLGFNWACIFLWFSQRYAFFSAPVIGVTSLVMAFYAAIALLATRVTTRNWRTALIVFICASLFPAAIVLRLGLLR